MVGITTFSHTWQCATRLTVTGAWPTILMSLLIRFRQDKGQIVHVLEIEHNGQVIGGVNTNGAPTGRLFNCPARLMAFDSIRIKASDHLNENTLPFSSDQRRHLDKIWTVINNQLTWFHLEGWGYKQATVMNRMIGLREGEKGDFVIRIMHQVRKYTRFNTN